MKLKRHRRRPSLPLISAPQPAAPNCYLHMAAAISVAIVLFADCTIPAWHPVFLVLTKSIDFSYPQNPYLVNATYRSDNHLFDGYHQYAFGTGSFKLFNLC